MAANKGKFATENSVSALMNFPFEGRVLLHPAKDHRERMGHKKAQTDTLLEDFISFHLSLEKIEKWNEGRLHLKRSTSDSKRAKLVICDRNNFFVLGEEFLHPA